MICNNLDSIRTRIREVAEHCGRNPQEIRLVAVSKRMPAEAVAEAYSCGQVIFGENYLQDAREKIKQLEPSLQWHFIGHLQTNKAKMAAELFQVIETVDRLKIARALNRHAGELEKTLEVLIQVNVGKEPQKSGMLPEKTKGLLQDIQSLSNLKVRGLMTMPPYGREPEASRPWFRELKQLADQLACKGLFEDNDAVELSMGMTGDFTVAIEEGATLVRVGTAIFGPRPN
ncbi:MAG: YggS family pyridoxal phosphate-dependent enzyme [Deltaproteobacteria bacterium]|nr:YggS family pyridoxal phosphate-dependent enzyme [Deltaproteobacteria bacterium]